LDISQQLLPTAASITPASPWSGISGSLAYAMPAGANNFTLTQSVPTSASSQFAAEAIVGFYDGSGNRLTAMEVTPTYVAGTATQTLAAPPAGAAYFSATASWLNNGTTTPLTSFSFYCSGQAPTGLQVPCCPPDPTTNQYLNVAINYLQQLVQQPAAAPVGYTKGTVHSGLTGSGSIAVSKLFGVLVDITAGTPTTPQLPGVPPYEWSVGWISASAPDGMLDERRISRQHQVWAPSYMALVDSVGYFLNPGFTVNLTELVPA
jgi:hypothetical protein